MMKMEEEYTVHKVSHPHSICVTVPGSKSITNRALLIAALSNGTCELRGVLFSDDSRNFLKALMDLEFEVSVDEKDACVKIKGCAGKIPKSEGEIYVGSAGTAARFLTAFLALSEGKYRIDASEQMRKRPMKELLTALESLGARFVFEDQPYHFPFTVYGRKSSDCLETEKKKQVCVDVEKSSQFLSALLISSVLFEDGLEILVTGTHGMAYVSMTVEMMSQFGVSIEVDKNCYKMNQSTGYQARDYQIEPDLSAACYFYAAGALLGVTAKVLHVKEDSLQGDIRFLKVLCDMGCHLETREDGIVLFPPEQFQLKGGEWDLSSFSDQALTLAAIAPFANGKVVMNHIGHIRYQECDRIQAILQNLKEMNVRCEEREGCLTIFPLDRTQRDKKEIRMKTYEDHRVAMAFSLPGLCMDKIIIQNPSCCRKTFENYFEVLEENVYDK